MTTGETGAAAGQERCVNNDQTPAVPQVAMAVGGAANPAARLVPRLIQKGKVFFPPLTRSDKVILGHDPSSDASLLTHSTVRANGRLGLKGATFTAHEHEATPPPT